MRQSWWVDLALEWLRWYAAYRPHLLRVTRWRTGSWGGTRTHDLRGMSPASFHCSTQQRKVGCPQDRRREAPHTHEARQHPR